MVRVYKFEIRYFALFGIFLNLLTLDGASSSLDSSYFYFRSRSVKGVIIQRYKIVGGNTCSIKDHPYIVSIQNDDYVTLHFCGGSLLSEIWVLTAAHCLAHLYMRPQLLSVVAGAEVSRYGGLQAPENTVIQRSGVERCILHPRRVENFDIALMKLKTPLRQALNVGFVKLPFGDQLIDGAPESVCNKSIVAGWGHQYAKNLGSEPVQSKLLQEYNPYLQCITLPVISSAECKERSGRFIPPECMCTYTENRDACQGDSGGPLMCNGIQYGIISSGRGCGYKHYPGIYTRVQNFEEFIKTVMAGYEYVCEGNNCKAEAASLKKRKFNEIVILVGLLRLFTLNFLLVD